MEFEKEFWWEDWVWKEHILPAWYNPKDKIKYAEENLGFKLFYGEYEPQEGEYHQLTGSRPLWMYVGELEKLEDIPRLIDVLLRGDGISRLRAMSCLEGIANDNEEYLRIVKAWSEAQDQIELLENKASCAYLQDDTQYQSIQDYAKSIWWRNDPEIDDFERDRRDKLTNIHTRKKRTKKQILNDAKIAKRKPNELDILFPWIPQEGEEEAADQAYADQKVVQTQFDWTPKTPTRPIMSPQRPKPLTPPSMIPPAKPAISSPPLANSRPKLPPSPMKKR